MKDSLPAIRFQRETLAAQPITDWINREYPDADILYFVSEEPVLCQQVPRKNIQLLFNKELLLNNLPNPSVHRISQRTEGLGDSVTVKDTLFHLVKHLNHSL